MAYRQLSTESIAEYLQGIPEMKKVFSSFNELDIREIGDGNLNYVYLVKNKEKPKKELKKYLRSQINLRLEINL